MRGDATTSQGKQEGSAIIGNTATGWHAKRRQHDKWPWDNQPVQTNCATRVLHVIAVFSPGE
jgi:hypothetical protein